MQFHLWTFLFEAINFVALAFVLNRLLYRPLHEAIDHRREATEQARAEAERAQCDARELQEQLQLQLAEAQRQRDGLLHQARDEAEAERRRLLSEAARVAERQEHEFRDRLDKERDLALGALQLQIVTLALETTRRFLIQAADRALHEQLVGRLLEALDGVNGAERERLRITWRAADRAVLETAEELNGDCLEKINLHIAELMGTAVSFEVQTRPELICGVRVKLGGHVWDASLAGSLEENRPAEVAEPSHA
jgi:F-type H+-transporting ATPase subunit b